MALQSHSQNTSIKDRVRVVINQQGDTLVEMSYGDAKILLEDVLHYEYADSLLIAYKERDSLNTEKIKLQKSQIDILTEKNTNLEQMVGNFEEIITNQDKEKVILEETIKKQKKEIRKQKRQKIVAICAAIILPILTLLAVS